MLCCIVLKWTVCGRSVAGGSYPLLQGVTQTWPHGRPPMSPNAYRKKLDFDGLNRHEVAFSPSLKKQSGNVSLSYPSLLRTPINAKKRNVKRSKLYARDLEMRFDRIDQMCTTSQIQRGSPGSPTLQPI